MEFLSVANGWLLMLVSAPVGMGWWLFRTLHAKVEAVTVAANARTDAADKALADFKLHCAETYVTSTALEKAITSLNDTIKAVFSKLERIEDKLDSKADK